MVKRIISTAIEVMAFMLLLVVTVYAYQSRLTSVNSLAILCVLLGTAIILSKAAVYIINHLVCIKKLSSKIISIIVSTLISIPISFGIFFAAFILTEWLGNMPATTKTLLVLSILATIAHTGISLIIDNLVEIDWKRFSKDMFIIKPLRNSKKK